MTEVAVSPATGTTDTAAAQDNPSASACLRAAFSLTKQIEGQNFFACRGVLAFMFAALVFFACLPCR